jgi:hypothetical protein
MRIHPNTIKNLLNPTEDQRRNAFEYYVRNVVDDDSRENGECIASIKGQVIQTTHIGQFLYVVTTKEAKKLFPSKLFKKYCVDPFWFGLNSKNELVEWHIIDLDSI